MVHLKSCIFETIFEENLFENSTLVIPDTPKTYYHTPIKPNKSTNYISVLIKIQSILKDSFFLHLPQLGLCPSRRALGEKGTAGCTYRI